MEEVLNIVRYEGVEIRLGTNDRGNGSGDVVLLTDRRNLVREKFVDSIDARDHAIVDDSDFGAGVADIEDKVRHQLNMFMARSGPRETKALTASTA